MRTLSARAGVWKHELARRSTSLRVGARACASEHELARTSTNLRVGGGLVRRRAADAPAPGPRRSISARTSTGFGLLAIVYRRPRGIRTVRAWSAPASTRVVRTDRERAGRLGCLFGNCRGHLPSNGWRFHPKRFGRRPRTHGRPGTAGRVLHAHHAVRRQPGGVRI